MKEKSVNRPKASSKTKKPDQQTYIIPSARANDDTSEYQPLFWKYFFCMGGNVYNMQKVWSGMILKVFFH